MLRQLKHTFRNFRKNPILLFVNIPGLTIGLSAFLLLLLFLIHELSYDRIFPNKNRIVRLYNILTEKNSSDALAICVREAYTELPKQIPEIEETVQMYRGWKNSVAYKQVKIQSQELLYADSTFFKVFGLKLLEGNVNEALKDKNSVIITQDLANKLFKDENPLGKIIKIADDNYTITGLIKKLPLTTHFNFDMLASMSSVPLEHLGGLEFFTYYLLRKNINFEQVSAKIAQKNTQIVNNKFKDFELSLKVKSGIEKLKDIHLYTVSTFDLSPKGDVKSIYIVAFLAFFILLIALVNHINLFVLHGEKRFMEIGIRKSLGADNSKLKKMFYFETAVITIFAFAAALLITALALPYFSQLVGKTLNFSIILNPYTISGIILFMIFLIFISGAYPAFYLSKLKVISAVKGDMQSIKRKKYLPVTSVLIQFSISIFLIFSLSVVYAQVHYLKDIPLGFSPENIMVVSGFNKTISKKANSIKDEINKLSFVGEVATSGHSMGGGCSGQLITEYGSTEQDWHSINEYRVRPGFCKTMGLEPVEGRFFNNSESDKNSIILNQAAVKMLNLKNPVGNKMQMFDNPMVVIGVVKDFYYTGNAREKIAPLVLTDYSNWVNVFYIKTVHELSGLERQKIAKIFNAFDPDYEFYTHDLQDIFNQKFSKENRVVKMLLYGTLLAIFLSFTGMFALSVFNVEQRTKEIGIRKVLGGSSIEILKLLLIKMLKWVVWTMFPAMLTAYILMNNWLHNFANKIEIGIIYFLFSGILSLLIAFIAVSVQSIYAATRNPVDSLRYE
jgi:putative ABC transport system permease protein